MTGTSEGLNGMCYFFLRSSNKAITPTNIAAEVNFGMMDCNNGKILQGLKLMLSQVMMPALKLQEVYMITFLRISDYIPE